MRRRREARGEEGGDKHICQIMCWTSVVCCFATGTLRIHNYAVRVSLVHHTRAYYNLCTALMMPSHSYSRARVLTTFVTSLGERPVQSMSNVFVAPIMKRHATRQLVLGERRRTHQ